MVTTFIHPSMTHRVQRTACPVDCVQSDWGAGVHAQRRRWIKREVAGDHCCSLWRNVTCAYASETRGNDQLCPVDCDISWWGDGPRTDMRRRDTDATRSIVSVQQHGAQHNAVRATHVTGACPIPARSLSGRAGNMHENMRWWDKGQSRSIVTMNNRVARSTRHSASPEGCNTFHTCRLLSDRGDWTSCSVSCGAGGSRTRSQCITQHGLQRRGCPALSTSVLATR